jgi:quinoprotein glucose dehydrogenase
MNQGEIAWQVAHGDGIRQQIIDLGIPDPGPVGGRSGTGPLLTKTLLFLGQGSRSRAGGQGEPALLTAYDKATGKVIANLELDTPPSGTPMSYLAGGKQYVVFAVGGGANAELLALSLP